MDKFTEEVKKALQEILAEMASASVGDKLKTQFEEVMVKATEAVTSLNDKVAEMQKEMSEKDSAMEDLDKSNLELSTELEEVKKKVEEVEKLNVELEERATNAEGIIDGMKKDEVASKRMKELLELKVVRKSEEAAETQKALVREMSEEEFSAYRDERVAIRNEILASFETPKAEEPEVPAVEPVDEEGAVAVAPADIEAARSEETSVLPNSENASIDTKNNIKVFMASLSKYIQDSRKKEEGN